MVSHREIKEYVDRHIGAHKHRYRLLGVSRAGRSYSFMCRECGIIQFYQKTGVISVITVSKRKFRKRWIKNFNWNKTITDMVRDQKEKEAWFFLSDYKSVHID